MSFSPEWESTFAEGGYAPGQMESSLSWLLGAFAKMQSPRTLELGAGDGCNVPYFLSRSAQYWGIEGSATAVARLHLLYPNLVEYIRCADFTKPGALPDVGFDLIFDRAAIAHNSFDAVRACVANIWQALKPGGVFIGSDWFSSSHSESSRGEMVDSHARTNYPDGQFAGIGVVNFFNQADLSYIFQGFEGVYLMERRQIRPLPMDGPFAHPVRLAWHSRSFDSTRYLSAWWDIVARRPE